jgi:hypothetical protein
MPRAPSCGTPAAMAVLVSTGWLLARALHIDHGPGTMLTRRDFSLGAACAALVFPAFAGDASAAAFVTTIYDSYKGKDAKGMPLDSERTIRRYFEPQLAGLMAKDQKAAARRGEVGSLDFDPFLDAQDWDVTTFDINVTDATAGKAQTIVKFVNLGQAMTVTLDLVQVNKAWRVYDISWLRDGKTEMLRKIFVH